MFIKVLTAAIFAGVGVTSVGFGGKVVEKKVTKGNSDAVNTPEGAGAPAKTTNSSDSQTPVEGKPTSTNTDGGATQTKQ